MFYSGPMTHYVPTLPGYLFPMGPRCIPAVPPFWLLVPRQIHNTLCAKTIWVLILVGPRMHQSQTPTPGTRPPGDLGCVSVAPQLYVYVPHWTHDTLCANSIWAPTPSGPSCTPILGTCPLVDLGCILVTPQRWEIVTLFVPHPAPLRLRHIRAPMLAPLALARVRGYWKHLPQIPPSLLFACFLFPFRLVAPRVFLLFPANCVMFFCFFSIGNGHGK